MFTPFLSAIFIHLYSGSFSLPIRTPLFFNMPKSKNRPATSASSVLDQQMADIAAQIAALSARQDAAIKEMERATAEVALKSKEHERLAQDLARAEIDKNRSFSLHLGYNFPPISHPTHELRASAEADRAVAQMAQSDGFAGDAAACLASQVVFAPCSVAGIQ